MALLRDQDWEADQLSAEMSVANAVAAVHVQCSDGPDPIAETHWIAEQARSWPIVRAIVGRADLTAANIETLLDAHMAASPLFRGVRDLGMLGGVQPDAVEAGLTALAARNLSWDLQCVWEQMDAGLQCARAHEDLKIALLHAGFPLGRDAEYLRSWRAAIRRLAEAPNVVCKLSGLGMGDHSWTPESWRPWLSECIDAFGADRCMFGSNFPVDRLYARYDRVLEAFEPVLTALSEPERDQILVGNAQEFYDLGPVGS
jgi:predicted TIM-barrel fold metal-dependent hydrolase